MSDAALTTKLCELAELLEDAITAIESEHDELNTISLIYYVKLGLLDLAQEVNPVGS